MRFAAPFDVSGITLSTGPVTVVGGFVDVPDDASEGDLGGLAANGFTPAPDPAPKRAGSKAQNAAPVAPAESPAETSAE